MVSQTKSRKIPTRKRLLLSNWRAGPLCVNLSKCVGVTAAGLHTLLDECGPVIAALHLLGCNRVDDACMQPIATRCPKLAVLDLSWSKISDRGVFTLARALETDREYSGGWGLS